MSTTLTKKEKLEAAAAAEARLQAEIETYKQTEPTYPIYAKTDSEERIDYHTKKKEYDTKLADLKEKLANANAMKRNAFYDLNPPKGGKKSRKSHNSKKYKKSKKSHTTYKKSKRSRR
jgi:hypothetical protein